MKRSDAKLRAEAEFTRGCRGFVGVMGAGTSVYGVEDPHLDNVLWYLPFTSDAVEGDTHWQLIDLSRQWAGAFNKRMLELIGTGQPMKRAKGACRETGDEIPYR
jgi:hypothetical protein